MATGTPKAVPLLKLEPKPESIPSPRPGVTLKEAADRFLADAGQRLKPTTMNWYHQAVGRLANGLGGLPIGTINHTGIIEWVSAQEWGDTSRAHALSILSVFFRWVIAEGFATTNPVSRIRKPRARSRGEDAIITPQVHKRLLAKASPTLKPLLILLHETGARPSEIARLTASDIDFANGFAKLQDHKTAGKTGKPRLIMLSEKALVIVRRLAKSYPHGPLVRNQLGIPWGKDCICLAFRRLAKRAGVRATAYGYRHTFATDALAKGIPDAHVAALLGHSSTAMLHKHYGHLTAQSRVLKDAANLVR
jgi:integrase